MQNTFLVLQIIISLLLAGSILIQQQGSGMGSSFGGSGEQYRSKRGVEKLVFRATIVLSALFAITSIVNLLVR